MSRGRAGEAMAQSTEVLTAGVATPGAAVHRERGRMPHPIIMMLIIIAAAVALSYLVPSGQFERSKEGLVTPGTYHAIAKDYSPGNLLVQGKSSATAAAPSPLTAIATAIPVGMASQAGLIFMIMFIGGMFGVLRETGALDAGIERLVARTRGNVYVLAPIIMIALSAGGAFLGLISEYLVIIPMILVLAEKLRLGPLFATALVTVAAKIGYIASVTNPVPLVIAQPILGLPVFSGAGFRFLVYVVFLAVGIAYVLRLARAAHWDPAEHEAAGAALSLPHVATLLALVIAVAIIVTFAGSWGNGPLGAFYIFVGAVIALINGMSSERAAEAFLAGMKNMVLAAILVGLAGAVEAILKSSLVLDTIINALTRLAAGLPALLVAEALVLIELVLDVLIPSTSGKAAVSLPILGPIAQLSGVSGQVTVLAFLFGNGLTNMITPTSGMLLAYLATGRVAYGTWLRFVLPLFALLLVLAMALVAVAVLVGY
jgi:uncharacterized ion transporter superfamily protein YfcC